MPENSNNGIFHGAIKFLLNILLILAILSTILFLAYSFVIPSPGEYDDPETDLQESFPWNPNIFQEFNSVTYLLGMGMLRHMAFFPSYVTAVTLISMVARVFFVLFINRIRKTFLNGEEIDISKYVEWGIGSIVGAIIYIAGTVSAKTYTDVALATLLLSSACLILYLLHPDYGFLIALKERISGTKKTEKPN